MPQKCGGYEDLEFDHGQTRECGKGVRILKYWLQVSLVYAYGEIQVRKFTHTSFQDRLLLPCQMLSRHLSSSVVVPRLLVAIAQAKIR